MSEFTREETAAIAQLKRAFTKCKSLGLKFSGMDCDLYVCNSRAFKMATENRIDRNADYNEVAFAISKHYPGADILLQGDPYVDSGGW